MYRSDDGLFSLKEVQDDDGAVWHYEDQENGYFMSMNITTEGVIFDVYDVDHDGNDQLRATRATMWDEIMDELLGSASGDPRYEGSED